MLQEVAAQALENVMMVQGLIRQVEQLGTHGLAGQQGQACHLTTFGGRYIAPDIIAINDIIVNLRPFYATDIVII